MSTEIITKGLEREGKPELLPIEMRVQTLIRRFQVLEYVETWVEVGKLMLDGGGKILSEEESRFLEQEGERTKVEAQWAMGATDDELQQVGFSSKGIALLNTVIIRFIFPM